MADIDTTLKVHGNVIMVGKRMLAFASGTTVKSFILKATAFTHTIVLVVPTFGSASPTATLSIENSDGDEIYRNAEMAESVTHVMVTTKPLVGDNTFIVTLSTDPLGDGVCEVTVYLTDKA